MRGAAVLCSIHQPSYHLFNLFDRVICLSDGHAIYNGPVSEIKSYMESNIGIVFPKYMNPSDYLIKLAISPYLIHPLLNTDQLKKLCDNEYQKMIKTQEY
jgi:ABC-type multidrug transport system ATPase subunit